jgi:hypothetical protein
MKQFFLKAFHIQGAVSFWHMLLLISSGMALGGYIGAFPTGAVLQLREYRLAAIPGILLFLLCPLVLAIGDFLLFRRRFTIAGKDNLATYNASKVALWFAVVGIVISFLLGGVVGDVVVKFGRLG